MSVVELIFRKATKARCLTLLKMTPPRPPLQRSHFVNTITLLATKVFNIYIYFDGDTVR